MKRVHGIDMPRILRKVVVMPKTLREVMQEAAELPGPERLKLARILLELSEPEVKPQGAAQNAWESEIELRLQELRSGRVKGFLSDSVKNRN
jgi:hypothetical protein